jgi:two-component system phosphate regulon sensor histidine kinase PhoR
VPLTLPYETARGERWISISGIDFGEGLVYAFRDVTEEHRLERLKSDFVATISHELRTPLAVLYGGALTLARGDVELPSGERLRLLEMMAREGQRLGRLVDQILISKALETGADRPDDDLIDPLEVVEHVVADMAAARLRPCELVAAEGARGRRIRGDRDHLRQIVANLIDNAANYSPAGSPILVRLDLVGERLRLGVADEGPGVAADERERIFEKFYRGGAHLTNGTRGTGLGLYIVRELAHRMDGRVWVEPGTARGSRFVVELPSELVPAPREQELSA